MTSREPMSLRIASRWQAKSVLRAVEKQFIHNPQASSLDLLPPDRARRYRNFAWDRLDKGSALMLATLPGDIAGDVADLGAGWGCLSRAILAAGGRSLGGRIGLLLRFMPENRGNAVRVDGNKADCPFAFQRSEPLDNAAGRQAQTPRTRCFDGD